MYRISFYQGPNFTGPNYPGGSVIYNGLTMSGAVLKYALTIILALISCLLTK